mgnify:CR=1 FL=1
MKNHVLFLSLFCLSIYAQPDELFASCPNTTVRCYVKVLNPKKSLDLSHNVPLGYLFGGTSVASYWHSETANCRPLKYSEAKLITMCGQVFPQCAGQNYCMVVYKKL